MGGQSLAVTTTTKVRFGGMIVPGVNWPSGNTEAQIQTDTFLFLGLQPQHKCLKFLDDRLPAHWILLMSSPRV